MNKQKIYLSLDFEFEIHIQRGTFSAAVVQMQSND
jgi:hypothetical protein